MNKLFSEEDCVVKTKELIDHAISKVPGPASRSVQVIIEWTSAEISEDESIIVPSVNLKWGTESD